MGTKIDDFVFLTPYVRHFSIGESEKEMDVSCRKRLERFIRTTGKRVRIILFTGKMYGCRDQIAYIRDEYEAATLNPAHIMVRKELLEPYKEVDFVTLCRIFLQEETFGVFEQEPGRKPDTRHVYRCRREGTYGTAPEAYREVLSMVREKYGEVPPFYQSLLIKDLFHLFSVLGQEEAIPLKSVLEQIDDDIICSCRCIPEDLLVRILSFKHGEDIGKAFVYRSGKLTYNNLPVLFLKEIPFVIDEIKNSKGRFNISGNVTLPLPESEIRYFFMDHKNKRHDIVFEEAEEVAFLGERLSTRKRFRVELDVGSKRAGFRFMYCWRDRYNARIRIGFDEGIGIEEDEPQGFCIRDGYLLRLEKRVLTVTPLTFRGRIKLFFTFPWKSIKMYLCKKESMAEAVQK